MGQSQVVGLVGLPSPQPRVGVDWTRQCAVMEPQNATVLKVDFEAKIDFVLKSEQIDFGQSRVVGTPPGLGLDHVI